MTGNSNEPLLSSANLTIAATIVAAFLAAYVFVRIIEPPSRPDLVAASGPSKSDARPETKPAPPSATKTEAKTAPAPSGPKAEAKSTAAPETKQPASTQTANAHPPGRYLDAVWNESHFKPAIDNSTNERCLSCHQDILKHKVRTHSPAGVDASRALAWYQTLDTYDGPQMTFHERHLTSPFAAAVMNLKCSFCHQGHDSREEAPGSSATTASPGVFALRKQVEPSQSCLMCHGKFPAEAMGLEGSWHDLRESLESPDAPNGCLTCHADQFRTVRHQVNFLKAGAIEQLAKDGSSDTCFGCHGGRAWYRTSFPYPRHQWPGMPPETPDWAKNRPAQSAPQHLTGTK